MDHRCEEITVDRDTAEAFSGALHEINVLGPNGEFLGRFRSSELIQAYSRLQPPISWEEMRRLADKEEGCTLEELLTRLGVEPCPTK